MADERAPLQRTDTGEHGGVTRRRSTADGADEGDDDRSGEQRRRGLGEQAAADEQQDERERGEGARPRGQSRDRAGSRSHRHALHRRAASTAVVDSSAP